MAVRRRSNGLAARRMAAGAKVITVRSENRPTAGPVPNPAAPPPSRRSVSGHGTVDLVLVRRGVGGSAAAPDPDPGAELGQDEQ